jgi:L-arabinose isomerase
VTALEPGSATLFALTIGPNQTWRMIASAVEIADFGPLDMQVPNFKITCGATDVRDWLTAYAKAGGPHHNAICFGDARRQIAAAARLLRAEYVEV